MAARDRGLRSMLLILFGVVVLLGTFCAGAIAHRYDLPPVPLLRHAAKRLKVMAKRHPPGADFGARFRRLPEGRTQGPVRYKDLEAEIRRLEALGYVAGSQPAVSEVNVTVHDLERAYCGFNLYTDGHASKAFLSDMNGNILHSWAYDYYDAFPSSRVSRSVDGVGYWRRVALGADGGLFAVFEGQGLIRLDAESRLVWALPEAAHHDLEVMPDDSVFVLTRKAEIVPQIDTKHPVLHDFIVHVSPDGRVLRRISVLDALLNSDYIDLVSRLRHRGDILHTNTVEVLDGRLADRLPAFRKGNFLVSILHLNTVDVVDAKTETVVWGMPGLWLVQHQPTVLDNGNLLIFDNDGDGGKSRVLEIDPATQELIWAYRGSEHGLDSPTCGSVQRLPNGNTLITETDYGRALEVSPSGETVWEFFTPHRAGESEEFIASLFEVIRLPRALSIPQISRSGIERGYTVCE